MLHFFAVRLLHGCRKRAAAYFTKRSAKGMQSRDPPEGPGKRQNVKLAEARLRGRLCSLMLQEVILGFKQKVEVEVLLGGDTSDLAFVLQNSTHMPELHSKMPSRV